MAVLEPENNNSELNWDNKNPLSDDEIKNFTLDLIARIPGYTNLTQEKKWSLLEKLRLVEKQPKNAIMWYLAAELIQAQLKEKTMMEWIMDRENELMSNRKY